MSQGVRLILIEDSDADAQLVLHELKRAGFTVEHERVEEEAALLSALERGKWDIVLSDWSLPRFSGRRALEVVRQHDEDLPFILVSGTIGEENAVEAMRAGAHDYVVKDRLGRLGPTVEREIREHRIRREHLLAQEALWLQAQQYRALIEKSHEGISLTSREGKNLYMSPTAERILGIKSSDRSRVSVFDVIHPDDREAVKMVMQAQLDRFGESHTLEFRVVRPDGTVRWLEGTGTNLLNDPAVGAIVGNFRDITDRKTALEALRKSEEQLRQAQKMDAIGRLAGGVAHDFNNLLSVILSNADIMLEDLDERDPMRADLQEIREASLRAADLTRQLLMFSRQQIVAPKVLDLNQVLVQFDKMLRRLVGEDIDLETVLGAHMGRVEIDPGQAEQVILNLVINARDAMPTGGKLTIETANVHLDEEYAQRHLGVLAGEYVMLAVSDTGEGMDKATQARIFEPFFTTKGVGKGTGLGLSTVFGIVKQSLGSIWVYSEPGHGSSFKIYLPRVDAPAAALVPPAPAHSLRGSETILLVEDEHGVRHVAKEILRRSGYKVLEAANAGEALLLCERHEGPIDLLLSDVVMPQMSGPELARRLILTRPHMKVLCMSGYTDDAVVRHGVLEAHVAYLQKPITPDSLTRKVREVLGS